MTLTGSQVLAKNNESLMRPTDELSSTTDAPSNDQFLLIKLSVDGKQSNEIGLRQALHSTEQCRQNLPPFLTPRRMLLLPNTPLLPRTTADEVKLSTETEPRKNRAFAASLFSERRRFGSQLKTVERIGVRLDREDLTFP